MGEVLSFPIARPARNVRRRRKGPWTLAHLKGKRPRGHPVIKRGPRGKVLIAEGQVWVEHHDCTLWVIARIQKVRETFYPHDVVVVAYRGTGMRILAETSLRQSMQVWEDSVQSRRELMAKLADLTQNSPESPLRGHPEAGAIARAFFGLDEQGNRVD